MNFLRRLRGSKAAGPQQPFEDEILRHSDAVWKEFHLDTAIPGLRMWRRVAPPVGSAVYMKFTGFFPHIDPTSMLPLLWDPAQRGWDPNFEEYKLLDRVADDRRVVYSKSHVPRWMRYLKVKPRDYVQEVVLNQRKGSPLSYFLTFQSIQYPACPERPDAVRGTVHFQGCLIEEAQEEQVPGTRVTVMAVNDIKMPKQFYSMVTTVMRRYPIKWYNHLAGAVGCIERQSWRPSPIPWLNDSEYIMLFYMP